MTHSYLLDTHIWLWLVADPARLSLEVSETLADGDAELVLSPLSVWEIYTLVRRERIHLGMPVSTWIDLAFESLAVTELPLSTGIARRSGELERPPTDPIDRFLVASAAFHDLILVTSDLDILSVGGCRLLSNRG